MYTGICVLALYKNESRLVFTLDAVDMKSRRVLFVVRLLHENKRSAL